MSDETQNGTMPKWRKDFPIQWGIDNYVTRREFTKFLVMMSGATVLGNAYFVLQSYKERHETFPTLDLGHVEDLQPGSVKLFRYPDPNDPAMLIRLTNGDYVAYKQRCTHLSCPVHYAAAKNRLECPCHNGAFDAKDGTVLEGPPPRPLPRIALDIKDGRIIAKGVIGT